MKHLCCRRSVTFVDVETTGVDPRSDRIVEIALLRLPPPGGRGRRLTLRLNPQRPIPAAASAVHGIRDVNVAGCPTFADKATEIATWFAGADVAGFGVARFDLPFLVAEFERAGRQFSLDGRKVVDALTLFHRLEPRDLAAAVHRYCGREHGGAHRSSADVAASVVVLDATAGLLVTASLISAACLTAAVTAAQPPAPTPAPDDPAGPARPIPFKLAKPDKPLLLLGATINGQGPFRFVLDTGAGGTIISPELAKKLDIQPDNPEKPDQATGAGGTLKVHAGTVRTFTVGEKQLRGLKVGIVDLSGISKAIQTDIDGIIGYNFLKKIRVTIDYPKQTVTFE